MDDVEHELGMKPAPQGAPQGEEYGYNQYPLITHADHEATPSEYGGNAGAMVPANYGAGLHTGTGYNDSASVRALDPNKDMSDYGYGSIVWKDRLEAWKQQQGRMHMQGGGMAHGGSGGPEEPVESADLPS